MAKKDKKKSKKDKSRPVEAVGAVRSAVERTFQATAEGAQTTRDRAAELVDEVAGAAAGRVRGVVDEQLKGLRREVEALSRRIAELEKSRRGTATASKRKPAGTRATTARKPAARKTTATRKPASARSASTARKPAATRSASTTRKPAAKRSPSAASGAKKRSASSSRSTGSSGSSTTRKSS